MHGVYCIPSKRPGAHLAARPARGAAHWCWGWGRGRSGRRCRCGRRCRGGRRCRRSSRRGIHDHRGRVDNSGRCRLCDRNGWGWCSVQSCCETAGQGLSTTGSILRLRCRLESDDSAHQRKGREHPNECTRSPRRVRVSHRARSRGVRSHRRGRRLPATWSLGSGPEVRFPYHRWNPTGCHPRCRRNRQWTRRWAKAWVSGWVRRSRLGWACRWNRESEREPRLPGQSCSDQTTPKCCC